MMFDIVTAKQGKPHVTAEQQARINASAFGPGRYILDVGDGLALSMADANTLTIGSGAIMADGRVIDNEEAVTVAIANGSQAAYRRDLVVYSIETDASTGITTGELSVLQGATATTESAAKDPSYTAGNLLDGDLKAVVPIARVKLAALTPTVEPLLSKVPNIASLRDSVYQTKTFYLNSPCMTPRSGCKAPAQLNVCGNICTLYVNGITTRTITNFTELVDSDGLMTIGKYLSPEFDSEQRRKATNTNDPVGCRLCGGSDAHLWLIKDLIEAESEMRFVFTWVR